MSGETSISMMTNSTIFVFRRVAVTSIMEVVDEFGEKREKRSIESGITISVRLDKIMSTGWDERRGILQIAFEMGEENMALHGITAEAHELFLKRLTQANGFTIMCTETSHGA